MKYEIKKYGAGGACVHLKKSDGFKIGDFVEIQRPNESKGMTEEKVIEIVDKRIDKLRGNY